MVEWVLIDAGGEATGASEPFATRAEAEAWFGTAWASLSADGTSEVILREVGSGEEHYRMSLSPE